MREQTLKNLGVKIWKIGGEKAKIGGKKIVKIGEETSKIGGKNSKFPVFSPQTDPVSIRGPPKSPKFPFFIPKVTQNRVFFSQE